MREKKEQKKKNTKMYVVVGVLLFTLLGVSLFAFVPWSTIYPPETTPDTTLTRSTFTLIDYRTGEDVTPWVEISVWTPDADDLPFDANDAQTIGNFDEEISSADANTVSIDLSDHAVAWLEIDPDYESDYGGYDAGVLYGDGVVTQSRDMRKLIGGINYNYRVYVYHIPTNVSVAMLGRGDMDGTGFPYLGDAQPYNNTWYLPIAEGLMRGTDGDYTIYLNMPEGSANGYHAGDTGGDEWNIDADELADIVADAAVHPWDIDYDLLWLQDQSNFRTIAPLYDLTDDTDDDFITEIEQHTNCFNIRFTMNTSISETDGNTAQVNFTIMDRDFNEIPAEILIHAEFVDVIFYEPITCYDQLYNFDVRIEFADWIYLTSVTTNRILTPNDRNNLGGVTLLNTMYLELHV